ncbi:uncharacterized protein [Chiloscyllium punctatum]|uniref:uncharacterized protein n=1 Tax=Chiloscyllium punctatum TaxID=137246 RepID=UPI003B6407C1
MGLGELLFGGSVWTCSPTDPTVTIPTPQNPEGNITPAHASTPIPPTITPTPGTGSDPTSSSTPTPDPSSRPCRVFTIPPDLPLTEDERSVLSKGLTFIPLRPRINEFNTRRDIEQFFRRLRLRAYFHNQDSRPPSEDPFAHLQHTASTWTPRAGLLPALDLFIYNCRRDINRLNLSSPLPHSNLSPSQRAALQSLCSNPNLTIKPADKGGAVVVWRTDLYTAEAKRQLEDTSSYCSLDHDPTPHHQTIISQTIQNLITSGDLPPTASNLIVREPRTARFYLLPKIHKPDHPGRPIVSACSCPTELISTYLDTVLSPLVQELPTYVRDTTHALHLLQDFRFPGPQRLIFTMDIQSLYTSIRHDQGLQALRFFLSRRPQQYPSTDTLIRLAELVLTLNNFSFESSHFLQTKGVAMGTRMGPSYACLFVGYVEQLIFRNYTGTTPHLFLRYIDDCIGATSCSREEVEQFINFTNIFHPDLKFTWTISDTSLPFLDLSISISDDRLNTDIFYKPTDSHSYLDYTSSHPISCKNAIPYSQFLRLRRICSQEDQFHHRTHQLASFFRDRNFPSHVVKDALQRISSTSRTSTLRPHPSNRNKDRTPLVLTFHPTNLCINQIIHRHFRHLQKDPTTRDIFPSPPLSAFRKDRSLCDYLMAKS